MMTNFINNEILFVVGVENFQPLHHKQNINEIMTAPELIQHLQQLPPDTKIVVRGYEDGYNDILKLRQVKIKPQPDADWYVGEYIDSNDADAIAAIDLFGENTKAKM